MSQEAAAHRVQPDDRLCHVEPVLGLPRDRADAILPQDLLEGGEIVILLLKPSPWYILLGALGHLTAIAAAVLVCVPLGLLTSRQAFLLGGSLIAARLVWQFFEWLSRIYVLTDRRVIRIMGVFQVYVFQAQLNQIQHTNLNRLLREWVFGLGTISFATAGTAAPEAAWEMLARPYAVHRQILQAIHRYR